MELPHAQFITLASLLIALYLLWMELHSNGELIVFEHVSRSFLSVDDINFANALATNHNVIT